MHTHTQYRGGGAQVGAGPVEEALVCSSTFNYSPRGMHPCAQAIIVNDKVTSEVIIVLN